MKKFERLTPEERRGEIMKAALELFSAKGFSSTTMENIVENVTLSKGGVYRFYPSTAAILSDLMISGMRMRNRFYEERATARLSKGLGLDSEFLFSLISDSLLMFPKLSGAYAEFLWEKKRSPELEELYRKIADRTVRETEELIRRCGAEELLLGKEGFLEDLTELMNSFTLSMHVLGWRKEEVRERLRKAMCSLLDDEKKKEGDNKNA